MNTTAPASEVKSATIQEKGRLFNNTDATYLMYFTIVLTMVLRTIRAKAKKLETENLDLFFRFVCMGKAMIDYAARGDLPNFKRLLSESDDTELMFWHVTKALKAAVKNKHIEMVSFLIDELGLSLNHEAFQKYLHLFLFGCQEAEMLENQEDIEDAKLVN